MLPYRLLCLPIDDEALLNRPSKGELAKVFAIIKLRSCVCAFIAVAARDAIRYYAAVIVARCGVGGDETGLDRIGTVVKNKSLIDRWRRFPRAFGRHRVL